MPTKLQGHEMVTFDTDVVIIGGQSDENGPSYESSLHRLTCQNQTCEWKSMSQQLKIARDNFVAMLIPGELVDCE